MTVKYVSLLLRKFTIWRLKNFFAYLYPYKICYCFYENCDFGVLCNNNRRYMYVNTYLLMNFEQFLYYCTGENLADIFSS